MKIKVFHLKDDLSISCVNILFSGDVKIGPPLLDWHIRFKTLT